MLRHDKWIDYSIKILKAANNGANTIRLINDEVKGPPAFIAKVIAVLRRTEIIDAKYELVKPYSQITVRDLVEAHESHKIEDEPISPIISKLDAKLMNALEISIADLY